MTGPVPHVSVVIPTYNRAHLVGRAMESVLRQSYKGFELIVVDDASTDETAHVVRGFDDARLRYVRHSENRGGSAARNTGIERADAEYIAFLDSDDEWLQGKLQHQIEVFRQAGDDVGLLYSDFVRVHPDGREEVHRPVVKSVSVGYPSRWLVRREVFEDVGGFDEVIGAMEDTEISIRIQERWRTLHDPVIVMRYYLTADSVSRSFANVVPSMKTLIERYGDVVTQDELSYWYMLLGKAQMALDQPDRGRQHLLKAALLRPLEPRHYGPLLVSLLGRRVYAWLRHLKRGSGRKGRT